MKREQMEKGLVSIIVPVYNSSKYLRNVLQDLLEQTYKKTEIIIIDDGSTDDSLNIIKTFERQDRRIKVVELTNGGVANARNVGLELAVGEYVRFIDSDDRVPPKSVENMVLAYKRNPKIDLVIGNYQAVPERGFYVGDDLECQVVMKSGFAKKFIKHMKSYYFGVPWNKLYKRSIIEKKNIRFNKDIIWCEDLLFNLQYYDASELFLLLNVKESVYIYYQHEGSITGRLAVEFKSEMERIEQLRFEKVMEFFEQFNMEKDARLEWKYSNLCRKLFSITRIRQNQSLFKRYKLFRELLEENEAYEYICIRQNELKIWKVLKIIIDNKMYLCGFLFFSMKGIISRILDVLMPKMKNKLREQIPKAL